MQFREDGSVRFAGSRSSLNNDNELIAEDEYSLEGNTIYLTGVEGYCSRLDGEYQVSLTEYGDLQFDAVDEECPERRELVVTPWNLVER